VPPASTVADGRDLARSIASTWVAKAGRSITAPMNKDRSAPTSPIVSDSTVAMKSSRIVAQRLRGR